MAWVKIDDQFFLKPRARRAGKDGRALFWSGLCYCAANRTDGVIVVEALPLVAALAEVEQDVAHLLVDVGLWDKRDGEFAVIDFLKFNPSRLQLEAESAAAAERQSRSRSRRDSHRDNAVSSPAPSPVPSPDGNPPPSTTVTWEAPPSLWTTLADKKLALTTTKGLTVNNPGPWKRKVAENARTELASRAQELTEHFDLTESQLVDVLLSESNPPWLINHRRTA